jgi:hypothetical protein
MKVALTTLSNYLYSDSRSRLVESAKRFGIADVHSFDFEEIKGTDFYKKNEEILSNVRTMGDWLWKPYIISEVLKTLAEGDIIIYCDAGVEIIADLSPVISICMKNEPILLFGNGNYINLNWTKRDSFVLTDCDKEEYWYAPHCDAAFLIFRKNELSSNFVNQWLEYGCNKHVITTLPNICGKENLPGFIEHRWDQSILSLLAQKYKLSLYRMPTQFGNHYKMHEYRVQNEFNCINQSNQSQLNYYNVIPYYNSPYGQLLNHHRSRNKGISLPKVWNDPDEINSAGVKKSIPKKEHLKSFLQKTLYKLGYRVEKI